ncbi:site-specific DNA-methyltransferase [Campylobacter sp. FMV-PI01]|uniref:Site-specific DNA-methyltransferase n=1 Tax=Campylobacter portucalensis TaxID=2608384 RepID=A0A6L5WK02_9BACT|nr:DNA methyltransferase [Campylobacter portucalensis]MSN96183.1 site-specific DNA-methyltransferase [Campylobacter portucalensis]
MDVEKRKIYLDETLDQEILQNDKAFFDESYYRNAVGTSEIKELLGEGVFSNPKPEYIIFKLIDLTTQPNDLVLDFHLGSRVIIMTVANSTVKSRV